MLLNVNNYIQKYYYYNITPYKVNLGSYLNYFYFLFSFFWNYHIFIFFNFLYFLYLFNPLSTGLLHNNIIILKMIIIVIANFYKN